MIHVKDVPPIASLRLSDCREEDGVETGHAFLFVLCNEHHPDPFALIEDVYVEETAREHHIGTRLVQEAIRIAGEQYHCYKVILTSRHGREQLHHWYEKLGFTNHGYEFRMQLKHHHEALAQRAVPA